MTSIGRLREVARGKLDQATWKYLESGADDGISIAEAELAWSRLRLRPRILQGVGAAATDTTLLGASVALPVMVAPNGRATRYHPDGELALARACAREGAVLLLASSAAGLAPALLRHSPRTLLWQQVYASTDRSAVAERLAAIRESGCRAVVLTADLLPRDGPSLPAPPRAWWEAEEVDLPEATHAYTAARVDDLGWLCAEAKLPVIVKGVLRGDDAEACLAAGAAGVIVSNHGGNQLDTVISSADALADIARTCGQRAEVYVDGGVRRGSSILKALALGARAVLVGRPASYALAADGEAAVAAMLRHLAGELQRAMTLCGAARIEAIDRTLVAP